MHLERCDVAEKPVTVRRQFLIDHRGAIARAAGGINALQFRLEDQVVDALADLQGLQLFARSRIQSHDVTAPAAYEEAVSCGIERHGHVPGGHRDRPDRDHDSGSELTYCTSTRVGVDSPCRSERREINACPAH